MGLALALLAALVLHFTGEGEILWRFFSDRERIQQTINESGALGPALFVLLLVLQAVVASLPAPALAMAAVTPSAPLKGSY